MSNPTHQQAETIMDKYWVWKRLSWRNHSYRYFFLNQMIRADKVPKHIKEMFEKYSTNNIGGKE